MTNFIGMPRKITFRKIPKSKGKPWWYSATEVCVNGKPIILVKKNSDGWWVRTGGYSFETPTLFHTLKEAKEDARKYLLDCPFVFC